MVLTEAVIEYANALLKTGESPPQEDFYEPSITIKVTFDKLQRSIENVEPDIKEFVKLENWISKINVNTKGRDL